MEVCHLPIHIIVKGVIRKFSPVFSQEMLNLTRKSSPCGYTQKILNKITEQSSHVDRYVNKKNFGRILIERL